MAVPPEGDDMDDDDPRRRPRIDGSRQWEVFYRDVPTEPMRHVGSVSAPSEDLATEQARTLFGDGDADLWLAPADEFLRLGGNDLAAKGEGSNGGTEHGGTERGDGAGDARGVENGVSVE
ncbi:Htur_1727 family rSAM-partnered candidate RiPP [Haloferax sp. KTX1]|uniref:Htur_1727 family rSAM-partnered candidate RiPP n=1 Tax=Haloferax sp. KTX1 TaxID=2600597 RepID=UPI0016525BFE|nr:Htur_1727 family rSAM-partnered candidate RiPP [Haloferax sp. KTX1]